jgi:hypothetical protein
VRRARLAGVDDGIVRALVVDRTENLPLGITFIGGVMSHRPGGQQR